MKRRLVIFSAIGLTVIAGIFLVHADDPGVLSEYAGMESREIKTLSDDDIRQLRNGDGWGLALAAELNGVPGPLHLLEIAEAGAMQFTDRQLDEIRRLRAEMRERTIPLGHELIELERELNRRFSTRDIGRDDLQRLLARIADTTARLRYEHLVTHLDTITVLTPHQVEHYNRIRGYTGEISSDGMPGSGAHSPHQHHH